MSETPKFDKVPIPAWGALISTACLIVGWNWDVSWHRSIGRDTVWTLPHIAVYVSLAVAVLYNAWLLFSYTFGKARHLPAVSVCGFRAPSPVFPIVWGCLLQFTGILFDNFWHEVYGLDIGVFSPAHAVLGFGILVFYFGQLALVAWYHNRASPALQPKLRWIMLLVWSFFVGNPILSVDPAFGPLGVRSAAFAISTAVFYPALLVLLYEYFGRKWVSTAAAALYMLGIIAMMQIFQFFPATPRFGPVYHEIPNFLPPAFPLLLIVPAAAVGLTIHALRNAARGIRMLAGSIAFVVVFNATNWMTSAFLMSAWAENRLFAGMYPASFYEQTFKPVPVMDVSVATALGLAIAVVVAWGSSIFGSKAGLWLRRVER